MSVARKDVAPVWTRSWPVAKQPQSIGEQLRKRRFDLGIRQSEAARRLNVSNRTLSLWECDRVYPTWQFQPRIAAYLGQDPFIDPSLGRPKGNETQFVAILAPNQPGSLGQQIRKRRLDLRKTRRQLAKELAVSVKTLWGWETGRRKPTARLWERLEQFLDTHSA